MKFSSWQPVPLALLLAGLLLVALSTWMGRASLGPWQYGIYAGCLVALASGSWLRRRRLLAERELAAQRRWLAAQQTELERRREQLAAAERVAERRVEQYLTRLDRREQAVAHKLVTYHEWLEFPRPVDLSREPVSDEELMDLARKDRQMLALLEREAQRLFENIRDNRYSRDGQFQIAPLRDDAYQLITRVAQIYQPQATQPLLETSLMRILRAGSRACLHFLVVLDQLPLNVKEYNVNRMYGYIRQAVKAYGMYKVTEPYWPYVNSAFYLSRLAMGASPVSLGAWWFAKAVGTRGAKALTTRILNRQALLLLHNVVRVLGYEVASIYGGDFRHRDANWIYAAELTELVSRFAVQQEILSHALKEVSALQLRNEYDRVYLYRCLAAHASADPEQYRAGLCLTAAERQAVAERLERFFNHFFTGPSPNEAHAWKTAVENRLQVQMNLTGGPAVQSLQEQHRSAIRSLASFLIGVKEREAHELGELLGRSKLFGELSEPERRFQLQSLQENPPYFFEYPEIAPNGPLADPYLADLIRVAVGFAPRAPMVDELLMETGAYLRRRDDQVRRMLDEQYVQELFDRLPASAPLRRVRPEVARAVLDLGEPDEMPRFVYGDVTVATMSTLPPLAAGPLWLVGFAQRLVVFGLTPHPVLVWQGDKHVVARRVRRALGSDCLLVGGKWLVANAPEQPLPRLRVAGSVVGWPSNWFQPLLEFCGAV